jgi:Fe-S cluster assembly scaffold protein SufB
MNIELHVPTGAVMTYTLESNVHQVVCYIGEHAQLTVLHAPHVVSQVEQTYVIKKSGKLVFRGWYELSSDMQYTCVLQGELAEATITLGFKGAAACIARWTTVQRHEAPGTTSSLVCKGLLADQAHMTHIGTVYVARDAINAHATLQSNHMLKSADARAHVQPNLEVLTDAVQCAHASAIGMFDEEMLFYMQTRGLDVLSATTLLEDAFFIGVQ